MITLKAILFTICVVLVIIALIASSYILYMFLLGSAIILFFLGIRSILRRLHGKP